MKKLLLKAEQKGKTGEDGGIVMEGRHMRYYVFHMDFCSNHSAPSLQPMPTCSVTDGLTVIIDPLSYEPH
jgi:hypothetical protein